MSEIIVALFNLKPGVDPETYEAWARRVDLPTVRRLGSILEFDVLRSAGILGGDQAAPYQYVELLKIASLDRFMEDTSTEQMQAVAAEFQDFADNPVFVRTKGIETDL